MLVVGPRPPGDTFSYNLLQELVGDLPVVYSWSKTFSWLPFKQVMDKYDAKKPSIFYLGVRDHFGGSNLMTDLRQYVTKNADRIFVLFTALEELGRELGDIENLSIVPFGGDITNHQTEYTRLDPVLEKDFLSKQTFICLNRQPRQHRVMLVSLLHALGMENYGQVTFMSSKYFHDGRFLDHIGWEFSDNQDTILDLCVAGFEKAKKHYSQPTEDFDIYQGKDNNNTYNFNSNLRRKYRKSFVEIISETTCAENSYLLTEKTLNCIYGCNFPIMIGGEGAIGLLRSMGFDVFDDIVNHSYDRISDPVLRIYQAIDLNKELLTNHKLTQELWLANKDRFIKNVDFAKAGMYNFYIDRANHTFAKLTRRYHGN